MGRGIGTASMTKHGRQAGVTASCTTPGSSTLAEALPVVQECKQELPELCFSTQEIARLLGLQAEQEASAVA